jgi:hypothetical protein
MRRYLLMILALGLVALPGCILTSGQIEISFDLPNVNASSPNTIDGETIDLNSESEYKDNKDKLKDLSDLAVLGKVTNLDTSPVNVEVWITKTPSAYTTDAALKADPTAVKIWGPFSLGAAGTGSATKVIDWNLSAKLFTKAGKDALLGEAKGDGNFSIYAVGNAATYNFTVTNGVLVLVIDAGI